MARFFSVNGAVESLPEDRAYAWGLLETMRCESGRLSLWRLHRARLLRSGAEEASLPVIERTVMDVAQRCADAGSVKLRLRYGQLHGQLNWDISAVALAHNAFSHNSIELFPCRTRLVWQQSANFGCKSLLRTRYDCAAKELPVGTLAVDGLMLDTQENVIESLRCNLLFWRDGRCYTPDLSRCGVQGVMRSWLSQKMAIKEVHCTRIDLENATEVALCNSVRGVIPVTGIIGAWRRSAGVQTRHLQQRIADELW